MKRLLRAIAILVPVTLTGNALAQMEHFDPLGKPPSEHTLNVIAEDAAGLPFDDTRDFDEARKGFIAEPDTWKVLGPEGNVVWDLHRYDFFRSDKDFPSVHPSLQRVSRLNMKVGLFEVIPGVYQVPTRCLPGVYQVFTRCLPGSDLD